MITPFLKDDAFLADVDTACAAKPASLHVWWLGQSGYLVAFQGTRLLLDPYLSDSLTEKYATTNKPHTRMTERVIAPERLTNISLITSTHNHTDHLDAETLLPLLTTNPEAKLIAPAANLAFVTQRLGTGEPLIGLEVGESIEISLVRLTAVPAAHEELLPCYAGFIVEIGPWKIYHSGDTIPYEGMDALLRPYNVDIALLPINGRLPERRVSGNLWGDEAATLAKSMGAKLVIPCHYDMFTFNTETPELFLATCETLDQPSRVLRAGERLTLSPI